MFYWVVDSDLSDKPRKELIMVFTAYDKVHFSQYDLYQEYASAVPGVDSFRVAGDLAVRQVELGLVISEFRLFPVLNSIGVLFDVYLLDEDGRFLGCEAGERLMIAHSLLWSEGKGSVVSSVPGFELANGWMVVWGAPVRVGVANLVNGKIVDSAVVLDDERNVRCLCGKS